MRRILLAGLFIFSLTLMGCSESSGPATKGEVEAGETTGISGMDGGEGDAKKGAGQLPPPPPLKIPPGADQ